MLGPGSSIASGLDRVLAGRRRVRSGRRGRARARATRGLLAGLRRARTGTTRRARAARGARAGTAVAAGSFSRDAHEAAAEVRVVELLDGVLHVVAGRELGKTGNSSECTLAVLDSEQMVARVMQQAGTYAVPSDWTSQNVTSPPERRKSFTLRQSTPRGSSVTRTRKSVRCGGLPRAPAP